MFKLENFFAEKVVKNTLKVENVTICCHHVE